MGFLNTNSMPHLVEKLSDGDNIKITGNSKGNRVGTVIKKIVEKADEVTKAIEQEVINNNYSFKVGTGNVDVSADVDDGFGEVGVKGIALQNCYPLLITSNFSRLNGTITSDEYVSMQGDGMNWKNAWISIDKCLIKPNTNYTLVCYVLENTLVEGLSLTSSSEQCVFRTTNKVPAKTTGLMYYSLRSIDDFTSVLYGLRSYLFNTETGKIVFKVMLLEGDHTNNPNLPSYFEGIVGVGDKSKNLLNPNSFKSSTGISMIENQVINIDVPTDGGQRTIFEGLNLPTGTYRVTTKVLEGEYTGGNLLFYDSNGEKFTENRLIGSYTINATNNDINKLSIWAVKGICKIRIQLEKGSSETPYEPYYDGHKIEILSHGKNLYKPNLQIKSANGLTFSLHGNTLIVNGTCTKIVDFRPINGTENITLELYNYVNKLPVGTTLKLSNNLGLKNFFSLTRNGAQTYHTNTLIIQEGDYGISCFVRFEEGQSYNNAELKIQLEINNVATEFEPYIEDKTQILLDEPLMKLPNGVCDEITRDGKLIRRVGKVVLDGRESWKAYSDKEDCWMFAVDNYPSNLKHRLYENTNLICDITPIGNLNIEKKQRSIFVYGHTANNELRYAIPKTILTGNTTHLFKQWLQANPTTVYYELAEPIITELPAPYLRIFKDGHLTFNTLVAPESTHVVQLNKSAQIERSIREVQGLDGRVGQLESFYDDMMLETSHKLNLLTYDFEYTKESEDI